VTCARTARALPGVPADAEPPQGRPDKAADIGMPHVEVPPSGAWTGNFQKLRGDRPPRHPLRRRPGPIGRPIDLYSTSHRVRTARRAGRTLTLLLQQQNNGPMPTDDCKKARSWGEFPVQFMQFLGPLSARWSLTTMSHSTAGFSVLSQLDRVTLCRLSSLRAAPTPSTSPRATDSAIDSNFGAPGLPRNIGKPHVPVSRGVFLSSPASHRGKEI